MADEVGVLLPITYLAVSRVFSSPGRLFRILLSAAPATAREAGIGIQTRRQASEWDAACRRTEMLRP